VLVPIDDCTIAVDGVGNVVTEHSRVVVAALVTWS